MDPKRLQIKTLKLVETIEARLARIEAALGIGVNADPPAEPQLVTGTVTGPEAGPEPEPEPAAVRPAASTTTNHRKDRANGRA